MQASVLHSSLVVLVALGAASAQQVPARPAPRPEAAQADAPPTGATRLQPTTPEPRMLELLQAWEGVSKSHETLYAQFTRTDRSPALVEPKVYEGQALLRKPNLACLDFQEVLKDRPKPAFSQRIVCTGAKVYQFLGPTKQVFVYPLAEDERRRAIEEGPLPFIFNMRVERALQRYTWRLLEERPAQGSKPATFIIEIIPLEDIDREEFSKALIMLNQQSFLPEALQLFHPNGKDTKTFVFKKVERNGDGNPAGNLSNYDGDKMAEKFQSYGFKVIVNPDAVSTAPAIGRAEPDPAAPAPAGRSQPRRPTAPPRR
jgi:TIGR03009 family protein